MFSDGKFIICDIIALKITWIWGERFFKILVFLFKRSLKEGEYLGLFSFEPQLRNGFLDGNSKVGLFDNVIQLKYYRVDWILFHT